MKIGRSLREFGILRSLGVTWLVLLLIVVVIILANLMVPYQPFAVRGVRITHPAEPVMVCPRDDIRVLIDRKFTGRFDRLEITETWMDAKTDRPVGSAQGVLPPPALNPSDHFSEASSPLLRHAPSEPGTYYVRIVATSYGSRYGQDWLKASGSYTFRSSNTLTVSDCEEESR